MDDKTVDLGELVGKKFDFYGVADNCIKLNDKVFEVVEDESDGYRSSMDYVRVVEADGRPFFAAPLARVRLEKGPETGDDGPQDTWVLRDATGHVWVEFGTTNVGDYYPGFCFIYEPKR